MITDDLQEIYNNKVRLEHTILILDKVDVREQSQHKVNTVVLYKSIEGLHDILDDINEYLEEYWKSKEETNNRKNE